MRRPGLTTCRYSIGILQVPLLNTNLYFLAQFLCSPELKRFCAEHESYSLPQIHQSFVNTDRIAAVIRKDQLLHYPEGRGLNGVIFERKTKAEIRVGTPQLSWRYSTDTFPVLYILHFLIELRTRDLY